jgi:type IV pilus assembly protein PilA
VQAPHEWNALLLTAMTISTRKPLITRLRDAIAGDGGFTLLETLAVMVIVGLLAAITVPQVSKWRDKAYNTSLRTDARNVAAAIEASYVDRNAYPAVFQGSNYPGGTISEMTAAGDFKLSTGNTISSYTLTDTERFTFTIVSDKTGKVATYANDQSPTISLS